MLALFAVVVIAQPTAYAPTSVFAPTVVPEHGYVKPPAALDALILTGVVVALLFAFYSAWVTSKIYVSMPGNKAINQGAPLMQDGNRRDNDGADVDERIGHIAWLIQRGAEAFLRKEFAYIGVFIVVFSLILFVVLGAVPRGVPAQSDWTAAGFTVLAFIVGSCTSIVSGYLGMKIAVYANCRTAISARGGYGAAFTTAFKAGAVMGFSLVGMGLIMLYFVLYLFKLHWGDNVFGPNASKEATMTMFECVAGYGLGGSSIALFGRVGGGIYTKAADVGADLVGKVENDLNEDDPRNPAVIADNVGDNVGDIAGMGSDLFGSFAESACAAMVIASQSDDLFNDWGAMLLPLALSGAGILVCFVTSFVATHLNPVKTEHDIEGVLKKQIIITTLLMTPTAYGVVSLLLPSTGFTVAGQADVTAVQIFLCICCGLWSGLAIGLITEYYTSSSYRPVKEVAESCETGAATNIIYGLALGYKSVIIPTFCLAITVYVGYSLAQMYGIAMAALGILSTLSTGLAIDAYGPICDNAGGIAEMAGMDKEIRERTDALDSAGNTTAAIGKGFAIGSAALVSLALFGAFVTTCKSSFVLAKDAAGKQIVAVDILEPFVFAGLLIGAMLPYWFSAMTMKSVGMAALEMVKEVRRQVRHSPGILTGEVDPDYESCIGISTAASLREMIPPGLLVILSPILAGFFFGPKCLAGLLVGGLVSGVQMAISASNTGGAWDNAKKYIEAGNMGEGKGKHSDVHAAAVIGDTVGDPLKDTSGPALNILIKLMAIISVVFSPALLNAACGDGLIPWLANGSPKC